MAAIIAGMGLATPEQSVNQGDAASYALDLIPANTQQRRIATALFARSGVAKRHSAVLDPPSSGEALRQSFFRPPTTESPRGPTTSQRMQAYGVAAPQLAAQAAGAALCDSGAQAAEITHLVLVSCSGFAAPGVDVALIRQLGLSPNVSRTSVGFMGCHGALNGLRVAAAFCEADAAATALVVAVELCSLHYQYDWAPERVIANSLFADGAAAAVVHSVQKAPGPTSSADSAISSGPMIAGSFSEIVPGSLDAMSWRIGDNGFLMTLSSEVPGLIAREVGWRLESWLSAAGLSLEAVSTWAIHPGGPRILTACSEALGLSREQLCSSHAVLSEYGNMSSPTILFVLDRLRKQPGFTPCVMLGFGPGLAIEALLLDGATTS